MARSPVLPITVLMAAILVFIALAIRSERKTHEMDAARLPTETGTYLWDASDGTWSKVKSGCRETPKPDGAWYWDPNVCRWLPYRDPGSPVVIPADAPPATFEGEVHTVDPCDEGQDNDDITAPKEGDWYEMHIYPTRAVPIDCPACPVCPEP